MPTLAAEQIADLVSLVRYWGEIPAVAIPKMEIPIATPVPMLI